MQRGRRGEFHDFGDPFAGFRGFGRSGSLVSSFFGGRDPFDDPFFSRPFGRMQPGTFHPHGSRPFAEASDAVFPEQQPAQQKKAQGPPVIQEISSDDDDDNHHSRSGQGPYVVQDPDEVAEENGRNQVKYASKLQRPSQQQTSSYSFQSSTVTYGGLNGAYYTSSTTRKTGGDGVMIEESKEADRTTGKATHRISRGIRDVGHSVTRKLNPDGKVETLQTLHNLNEDELAGFEEEWNGNARDHLPGWDPGRMTGNKDAGPRVLRALPSTEQASERTEAEVSSNSLNRNAQ